MHIAKTIFPVTAFLLCACSKPAAPQKTVEVLLFAHSGDSFHCQHCVNTAAEGMMGNFPEITTITGDAEKNTLWLTLPASVDTPSTTAMQDVLFPLGDGTVHIMSTVVE